MNALADRISELEEESGMLRSKVDARYTANVLLGLGGAVAEGDSGETLRIRSSHSICKDLDKLAEQKEAALLEQQKQAEEDQNDLLERCTADVLNNAQKRKGLTDAVSTATAERRAKGKYTPQERDTIRRERNRIHAKKTRDRKKIFLEFSEKRIESLEAEISSLRAYLVSTKVLSTKELSACEDKDKVARFELASLRDTNDSGAMDTLLGFKSMSGAATELHEGESEGDVHDADMTTGSNSNSNHSRSGSSSTDGLGSGMYSSDSSVTGSPNHGVDAEEGSISRKNNSDFVVRSDSRKRWRQSSTSTFLFGGVAVEESGFMSKHGFVPPPPSGPKARDIVKSSDSVSDVSDDKTDRDQISSNNSGDEISEDRVKARRQGVRGDEVFISSGGSDDGNGSGSGSGSIDGSTEENKCSVTSNLESKPSLSSLSVSDKTGMSV
jgi:hypothetical protein